MKRIKGVCLGLALASVAGAAVSASAANYLRSSCGESSNYHESFTKNENWAVGSRTGEQCPSGALHADEDYVVDDWMHLQCRDGGDTSVTFGGKSLTLANAYPKVPYATTLEFPRDGLIFSKYGGLWNSLNLTLKGKMTFLDSTSSLNYYPGFYGAKGTTLTIKGPLVGSGSSCAAFGLIYSGQRAGDNYTVRLEGDVSGFTGRLEVLMDRDDNAAYAIDAPNWRTKLLVAGGALNTTLFVRDGCYIGVANDNETLSLGGTLRFKQNSGIAVDYAGTTRLDGALAGWTTPVRILTGKHLDDGKSHSFAAVVAPVGKTFSLDEFNIADVTFAEGTTVEYSIKTVDSRSVLWCDVKAEKKNILRVNDADGGSFVKNENWKDYETGETCPAGALDPTQKYWLDGWKSLTLADYEKTGKVTFGGKSLMASPGYPRAYGTNLEVEFPRDGLMGVTGDIMANTEGMTLTLSGKFTAGRTSNDNYPFGFIGQKNATIRMLSDMHATSDSTGISVGYGWSGNWHGQNFTMAFLGEMSDFNKPIWVRYDTGSTAVAAPAWGVKALFGEITNAASTVKVEQSAYVGAATAGKTAVLTGRLYLRDGSGLAIDNTGILRVDGTLTLPTVTKVLVGTAFNDGATHSFPAFQAPTGMTLDVTQFELADTGYFSKALVSLSVKETDGRSTLWCDVTPIQDNHIAEGCNESTYFYDTFRKNENWAVGTGKGPKCPAGALDLTQGYFADEWTQLQIRNDARDPKVTFGGLFLKMNTTYVKVYGDNYELEFPRMGMIGQCGTFGYWGSADATLTLSGAFRSELTYNANYPFGFIGTGNKIRLTGEMTASSDSIGISVGRGWSGCNCGENFTVSFEGDLSQFNKRILVQYGDGSKTPAAPAWGAKALFGETTMPGEVSVKHDCYVGAAVDGKTATLTGSVTLASGAGLAIDSTGTLKVDGSFACTKPIRVNVGPSFAWGTERKFIAFLAPTGTSLTLSDFDLTAGRRGQAVFSVVDVGGRSALCCERPGLAIIVR